MIGKFNSVKLLATGSFLQELSRRLFVIILIAVVPILGVILYQARLARDLQSSEALEEAWYIVENVAIREVRFIDSAKQLLSLLAETSELANSNNEQCSRFLKRIVEHNQVYVDRALPIFRAKFVAEPKILNGLAKIYRAARTFAAP